MLVDETITYLEMTSPDQLVPGRPPPTPIDMERHDHTSLPLLRSTYTRIGAPHGWVTRPAWSDAQWQEWLSAPGVQPWIARVGGEVAGMVELELPPGSEVEIEVFGLVPEFVGKGLGGHRLTLGIRLAWEAEHPDGTPTRRVWLQTSSRDHPHAKANYQRRGFRPFRTEQRRRESLDRTAAAGLRPRRRGTWSSRRASPSGSACSHRRDAGARWTRLPSPQW